MASDCAAGMLGALTMLADPEYTAHGMLTAAAGGCQSCDAALHVQPTLHGDGEFDVPA
jgi:hypothetical protein